MVCDDPISYAQTKRKVKKKIMTISIFTKNGKLATITLLKKYLIVDNEITMF